jgi:STE24 endopeptidase
MAKKWGLISVVAFGLYVVAMYVYFFHSQDSVIPATLKGTVADPSTFLTAQEMVLSEDLSKIRNFLYFIATPFEWLLYFIILISGISRMFESWSPEQQKWTIWKNAMYLFLLSILLFVLQFPLDYYKYSLSKSYGISTQVFSSWMRDNLIDFWMDFGMTVIMVTVLYWLIRNTKRWWLYAWALTVPFSIFLMFIQPVVIDPIYNDFYPLKDKALETKILSLAEQADIPSEHVYEVNMSEKTNSLNAYVTGIGGNSRIVLWDTTLNRLTDEEILFIMAHEMGHYVMKDIYIGIAEYLVMTLIGLWLIAKIMPWMIRRYGSILKIKQMSHIHSLPLFLLISSVFVFFSSPLSNGMSRFQEVRADEYAMELVEDREAAVSTFQQLTKAGLSEVNPSKLVKWFRYSHPPMIERITKVAGEE